VLLCRRYSLSKPIRRTFSFASHRVASRRIASHRVASRRIAKGAVCL
jgi:hypothetical protein